MFDSEIFKTKRVTPPARSGFRAVGSGTTPRRHRWPVLAIASCLFALAGLRCFIHNWRHADAPWPYAAPLLAIALFLGAWNRYGRRGR